MTQTTTANNATELEVEKVKNEKFYQFLGSGLVPEFLIRQGIRMMLADTLRSKAAKNAEDEIARRIKFVEDLKTRPIAIRTREANEQHYEVPTEFFKLCLGPHVKYSCAWWDEKLEVNAENLGAAEKAMLELSCKRADLQAGQKILDLGCGWGALSLFIAKTYPDSQITSISNSQTQRQYIQAEAEKQGLKNITVKTCNMEIFSTEEKFDRIMSVEMFEHMKNYDLLLERISGWLKPNGKLFVHIFTHKTLEYHYEDMDGSDWLTRHFFEGGMMPSDSLLLYFQRNLKVAEHWRVNGVHYQKTAEAWLQTMSKNKAEIMPILAKTYGDSEAKRWWVYWRLFFLACVELWGYAGGEEWMVSHYLFEKP